MQYLRRVLPVLFLMGPIAVYNVATLATPPDKPVPKTRPPMPVMEHGQTNWGTLNQSGKKVTLDGHPRWSATGEWRWRNERWELAIEWQGIGDCGPGVYAMKDGVLHGHWKPEGDVVRNDDGTITGLTLPDRIERIKASD